MGGINLPLPILHPPQPIVRDAVSLPNSSTTLSDPLHTLTTSTTPIPNSPLPSPTSPSSFPISSTHPILSTQDHSSPVTEPPQLPSPPPPRTIVTRLQNNIIKPNKKYAHPTTTTPSHVEPTTITQALKNPQWRATMTAEFDALTHNHTWVLVPPHDTTNLVGCKWVYRIKYKPNGEVERYKARLVSKDFLQHSGIDFQRHLAR